MMKLKAILSIVLSFTLLSFAIPAQAGDSIRYKSDSIQTIKKNKWQRRKITVLLYDSSKNERQEKA